MAHTWGFWAGRAALFFSQLFVLYAIWDCIRKEPDAVLWLLIIAITNVFGAAAYFVIPWLRAADYQSKHWTFAEIQEAESAAKLIGNSYQFLQLGNIYRDMEMWTQAVEPYTQALAKKPNDMDALWGLACVEMQLKNYASALARLDIIVAKDAEFKNREARLQQARALVALGDSIKAQPALEAFLVGKSSPEARYLLAKIHADKGETSQARKLLETLFADLKLEHRSTVRMSRAWIKKAKQLSSQLAS